MAEVVPNNPEDFQYSPENPPPLEELERNVYAVHPVSNR